MPPSQDTLIDSRQAWVRLTVTIVIITLGASGMFVVPVVLPPVQAEFGVSRAAASAPYTLLMIGFGLGGLLMGRLSDRFGMQVPLVLGASVLAAGFVVAAKAPDIWTFNLAHGLLIGVGCSSTFSPLLADTSLWFEKRRGIAVAICASGNYLGGALWPPIVQHFVETVGWRQAYLGMALVVFVAVVALSFAMRTRVPLARASGGVRNAHPSSRPFGLSPRAAQVMLCIAGLSCCVAMSMPQVHIVAYCGDLGYGTAAGAQMLSLMLACGIVSRLVSGVICDRIGGLRTLLLGSVLQGIALLMFLPFKGLVSLYVISALFGLFQGGLVPSYAIIVREHFEPREAGARVGAVIMCTLFGMALGGWMSGRIYDATGSYQAAFFNGIGWNLLNLAIAFTLLTRTRRPAQPLPAHSS